MASLSLSGGRLTEGDSGYQYLAFTVSLSQPVTSDVTFYYRTLPGTASGQDIDYQGQLSTGRIAAGNTSVTIQVRVYGDTIDETDEDFSLEIGNPTNADLGGSAPVLRATGIILDNDGAGPNLALFVNNPEIVEGDTGTTNAQFVLTLSRTSASPITLSYTTADGSAKAGEDYTRTTGTVTFQPGQTTATVNVPVSGDTKLEGTENFSLVVTPTSAIANGIAGATGIATILDDDAGGSSSPTLSVTGGRLVELNSSYSYLDFLVQLSEPTTAPVSFFYRTIGGTASENIDYQRQFSTATLQPGTTSLDIQVRVYGNTIDQTDRTFTLEVSDVSNAVIAGNALVARATGVILDDDGTGPNLALAVSNPIVVEGNTGATAARFDLTLSQPSATAITLAYTTAPGTATAGEDYTTTAGTVTFLPGQTVASVDVPVLGDTVVEGTENFSLVTTPTSAIASGVAGATGLATVLDDDSGGTTKPTLNVTGGKIVELDNSYRYIDFDVRLSAATTAAVTFHYQTVGGTATQDTDYASRSGTATINAGNTWSDIQIPVYGDTLDETDEDFSLVVTNPTNAALAGNVPSLSANGVILDDDGADPKLALFSDDPSVLEGDSGTRMMHFGVQLSRPVSATVTVPYATSDGGAVAGKDYVASSGTLTFLPGQTTASVNVPIIGDVQVEGAETFSVVYGSATSGGATAATTATGTIVDDDSRVTTSGTSGNDSFSDDPRNQLFVGGAGTDTLIINEGRRGDTFILNDNGDVDIIHGSQVDTVRGVENVRFIDGRMVFDPNDPAAQVTRLYQAALGRVPDQSGLNFWTTNIQRGIPLSTLADVFVASAEFATRYGAGLTNNGFVSQLYLNALGRAADAGGLAYWTGLINSGAYSRGQMLTIFSESPENRGNTAAQVAAGIWDVSDSGAAVARMYDATLGRMPDLPGLSYLTNQLDHGLSLNNLAAQFIASPEFQSRYGSLDNAAFVNALYVNTLRRPADSGGSAYWTNQLANGQSRTDLVVTFSESPEHQAVTADSIMSNNPSLYGIAHA